MAVSARGISSRPIPQQPTFDDLGTPLADVTFCVVDLETTGGGEADAITEIGAVKVRGGEVQGEFQTLVNPLVDIPALIAVLTGITNDLVASAPRLAQALPAFLEFARGSVLVAHNARFDVGFLKRACAGLGYPWAFGAAVDTVALARQALLRDEVPNVKLATLARHFRATATPNHRALADARATVDVFHGLLERTGNLGVVTLEDLKEFLHHVSPQRRAKRTWAAGLPTGPGVYMFYADLPGKPRQILYVGKSRSLRARVRSYFTAAETRPRMDEMIRIATGVEVTECPTPLAAEVRELRLIAAHAPRYNRRSKHPQRHVWLRLTDEPFPRLSIVRQVSGSPDRHFGPFAGRRTAEDVKLALQDAFPLRQCTKRISVRSGAQACALAEIGRCSAPCTGAVGRDDYARIAAAVQDALQVSVRSVLTVAGRRLDRLVGEERFEEAAVVRDRIAAYSSAAIRHHRVASLAALPHLVAAYRVEEGWEIHVIRHGRLAGAALARAGEIPQAVARAIVATAETVSAPVAPQPAATVEETLRIADWLERPGVRLMEIQGDWSWPIGIGLSLDRCRPLPTAAGRDAVDPRELG
ncbi:DEDD exonuclease domain-containing protein [Propionicicella superfundia]|uniref:DEDD exonuclease domain-containing protein n=1 Tax=Propionicicella superfundia TaxID=348582 RepID=UPI000685BA53|nr:DEDD exonuclease domain-containing protein [Propionicicella superfundia]